MKTITNVYVCVRVFHLPCVEITRVSPRDYPVNLTFARANNSSTLRSRLRYFRQCRFEIRSTKLSRARKRVVYYLSLRSDNIPHKERSLQDRLVTDWLAERCIGDRNKLLNFHFHFPIQPSDLNFRYAMTVSSYNRALLLGERGVLASIQEKQQPPPVSFTLSPLPQLPPL